MQTADNLGNTTQHNTTSALLQQNSSSLHGSIEESIVLRSYKKEIVCLGVLSTQRNENDSRADGVASEVNVRHGNTSFGPSEYLL
jgi:hypothetical protein